MGIKKDESDLPLCKKPGIINPVSGEGNKMDIIFPVIADSVWGCAALLCDDRGITKSAEERMETFEHIMEKAQNMA